MKIYISKYALSKGILETEIDFNPKEEECIYIHIYKDWYKTVFSGKDKEWHLTKKAAIARAEEMRIAKLKSLDKQHKKISGLVFE